MPPTIQGETLTYRQEQQEQRLTVGTAAWFAWLEIATTFRFVSEVGSFTARREQAGSQRGGWYWKAYRKHQGQLTSRYLGKADTLTLDHLRAVALALVAAPDSSAPVREGELARAAVPPITPPAPSDALHLLRVTKLHQPRPRAALVERPALIERLQQGLERPLTLVSAPAGFGKTTLLAHWLSEYAFPVAWVSLEPEDNDPVRFLSYFLAALQRLDPHLGTDARALLHTAPSVSLETVLTLLTNELLAHTTGEVVVVLDDYHVIESEAIHRGMGFLLEQGLPHVHLILATRADPPLPLSRLRARGQLSELRAADLRFAPEEVNRFLHDVMRLDLASEEEAHLHQRTEGWIAGLQLAALSLRGRPDSSAFLASFTGSQRFVLDYLSEEVLARQPARVQMFLRHTSILERLSGPLCDALTGQERGQAMLEAIEQANLFVAALDDKRGWYRYHPLFAEMLRSRLHDDEPALLPELHERASRWYEQQGLVPEAVQHALLAQSWEHAARLIEQHAQRLAQRGQIQTVLSWLDRLPLGVVRARPLLCIQYADMLMFTNHREAAEEYLQAAERDLQAASPAEQARTLRGYIAVVRASLAMLAGDLQGSAELARHALDLLPEAEDLWRSGARLHLAREFLVSGDVSAQSERGLTAVIRSLENPQQSLLALRSLAFLARLQLLQGRPRRAAATLEEMHTRASGPEGLRVLLSGPAYCFGLGALQYEWNYLDQAAHTLSQGMSLLSGTLTAGADEVTQGYLTLARLQQASGHPEEALATLQDFHQVAEQHGFMPHLLGQGAALHAQLALRQGNLEAAVRWAETSGLSPGKPDTWMYPQERQLLTLVRVRIAQGRQHPQGHWLQEDLDLLERLLADAQGKARLSSALEILLLQALTLAAQGESQRALAPLEQALTLAAPEGYVRLFADEGTPLIPLLRLAYARGIAPSYVASLLIVLNQEQARAVGSLSRDPDLLLDPLTAREREVLRLLLAGASNAEIAQRLVLSVGTVKKHVANLCGKLGVQSRTQAMARARALKLG